MAVLSSEMRKTFEFWLAVVLMMAGIALLFLGFFAVPVGEISASVLTAFGEIGTFSGSVIGIDYNYRYKIDKLKIERED